MGCEESPDWEKVSWVEVKGKLGGHEKGERGAGWSGWLLIA